jgi:hypothetical protein
VQECKDFTPGEVADLLHVIANLKCRYRRPVAHKFNTLLDVYVRNKMPALLNTDSNSTATTTPAASTGQQVPASGGQQSTRLLLEVLKTCLIRHHADYTHRLVGVLGRAQCEPGGCSLLLGPCA